MKFKTYIKTSVAIFFLFNVPTLTRAQTSDAQLEEQLLKSDISVNESLTSDGASDDSTGETPPKAGPQNEVTEKDREVTERNLEIVDEAVKGPKDIPPEHILVVQYRFINKEGRHEFTPIFAGLQPADSFRKQLSFGLSYTYHLTEDFGLEVLHASFLTNLSTKLAGDIRHSTGLETERIEPVYSVGSALLWTPLRSKAATKEEVYYFEGFFTLGGGFTKFETDSAAMAMAGLGFRSYLSENAILKTELRDYIDFRDGIDHRATILIGASMLYGD